MLAESRSLLRDSAEPGILDIKRHEPGILVISLQVGLLFKLASMA